MYTNTPLDFCLLIPCYNNLEGLLVSLDSVAYATRHYLVVVVDDGSREAIDEEALQQTGKPVKVLRHDQNRGITAALNTGLEWITTEVKPKYVARLDCGDRNMPQRFNKQVRYLDEHPEVGLVGSWCHFEGVGESYTYRAPEQHREIERAMYFRNVFIHPCVMFRADLRDSAGLYPTDYPYAEDYAYFWKMIKLKQSFVFQEVLVITEINKAGLSFSNRGKQLKSRQKIVQEFGTDNRLKFAAILRLKLLFLIPKRLILQLKKWKG